MLTDHFQAIFCINLERRSDRLAQAQAEFEKYGIRNVEFIKAVDGSLLGIPNERTPDNGHTQGEKGCILSHLNVVKLAKDRGLGNYLVFEDDVEFNPDFRFLFQGFMQQVPGNWDMLYLGGNHQGGYAHISDNVARIGKTYTTHAFAVKNTIFDKIIAALEGAKKADVSIAGLHAGCNAFVFRPHLAWQRDGRSDITEREEKYDHLKK